MTARKGIQHRHVVADDAEAGWRIGENKSMQERWSCRSARATDVEEMAAVYADRNGGDKNQGAVLLAQIRGSEELGVQKLFVAVDQTGRVVAYLDRTRTRPSEWNQIAYVCALGTHKGSGAFLIDYVCDVMRQEGYQFAFAMPDPANIENLDIFWKGLGFEAQGSSLTLSKRLC